MNKFFRKIKDLFTSLKTFFFDYKLLLAKVGAYLLVVVIFYFIFLWFFFPYNELATRLTDEFQTKTGMNVTIRNATGAFPLGIDLSDVVVTKIMSSNENPLLEARTIKIVPDLLSLFRGWVTLKVYARLYNGEAWINISSNKTDFSTKCKLKNIYIDKYSLIKSNYGLNLEGILNANFNITGSLTNLNKDKGNAVVKINHMILHPSKILGIFTLPNIDLGDINIPIYIKEGRLSFQDANQASKDLSSKLDGNIILLNPISNSILNLKLKFNPSPELDQQIKKVIPIFNLTRDAAGYYNIPITGNLTMPRFE